MTTADITDLAEKIAVAIKEVAQNQLTSHQEVSVVNPAQPAQDVVPVPVLAPVVLPDATATTTPLVDEANNKKANDDDFDPLRETDNNVIAIRMPAPDWTTGLVDTLKNKYSQHVRLLTDIDTIKVRKSLNKNEDDFVQSVVTYYLSAVDAQLKSYLDARTDQIQKLLKNLRHIVSLDMALSKDEKAKMAKDFNIEEFQWEKSFYVYESCLKSLNEWRMLSSIGAATSTSFVDIAETRKDDYIVRITDRVYDEFKVALATYIQNSQVMLKTEVEPPEYLGSLRKLRRKSFGIISYLPDGSEGDFWKRGVQNQAYNEDSVNDYTYKEKENGQKTIVRQRTVKFSVNLQLRPFAFDEAVKLIDQVKTISNGKGKGKAKVGTPY